MLGGTMPTVTTPVPAKMSQKQRSALLAEVAHAFEMKFVCMDHNQPPRCEIKGDELRCEVCCEQLALMARISLPSVVRMVAARS
jgi:hypothetical protein